LEIESPAQGKIFSKDTPSPASLFQLKVWTFFKLSTKLTLPLELVNENFVSKTKNFSSGQSPQTPLLLPQMLSKLYVSGGEEKSCRVKTKNSFAGIIIPEGKVVVSSLQIKINPSKECETES